MTGFLEWLLGPSGARTELTHTPGQVAANIERRKLAAAGNPDELAFINARAPRLLEGYMPPQNVAPVVVPAETAREPGLLDVARAARQEYRALNQALKTRP